MHSAPCFCMGFLILGGNANNGTNAGRFYGNWNNTAGNSNWNYAARPLSRCCKGKHRCIKPHPMVKIEPRREAGRESGEWVHSRKSDRRERIIMPKRIGFLYEDFVSLDNCIRAEKLMAKNKPDNNMARHIGENAEQYGARLHGILEADTWVASPNREFDFVDSYKGKVRHLKVPCLIDQSVQYAWLNIATPHIEKRNYFYNCGSIPGAGQSRAVEAMKKWLGAKKPPKYGGIADIYHFYDTCPHWVVMKGLRRIFKDERFLSVAEKILKSMSQNGIGLAIGHPSSHWMANVALMEIDHVLKEKFPDVKMVRYMDDFGFAGSNKRHIRKALLFLAGELQRLDMKIKHTWQVFQIKLRGMKFLSYRFFHGFTILAKPLMYRIARRMKKAATHLDAHTASGIISYMGILKHCNSYNFRKEYVYPFISLKACKEVVRNAQKDRVRRAAVPVSGAA